MRRVLNTSVTARLNTRSIWVKANPKTLDKNKLNSATSQFAQPFAESAVSEEWLAPVRIVDMQLPQQAVGNGAGLGRIEGVVPTQLVQAGVPLMRVERTRVKLLSKSSWNTLQVGEQSHVCFAGAALKLNHAAYEKANCRIKIVEANGADEVLLELVAKRHVPVGEPLTFDYNTTEWRMAEPFVDWSDATEDEGTSVGGFANLPVKQQEALLSADGGAAVAPHIKRMRSAHVGGA